jgi:hypothetical protein
MTPSAAIDAAIVNYPDQRFMVRNGMLFGGIPEVSCGGEDAARGDDAAERQQKGRRAKPGFSLSAPGIRQAAQDHALSLLKQEQPVEWQYTFHNFAERGSTV